MEIKFKPMKRLLIVLLSCFTFAGLSGQMTMSGQIKGRVLDASGQAFENVTVAVYSMPDSSITTGVATDKDGDFIIDKLPESDYTLSASFIGYGSKSLLITVSAENPEVLIGDIILVESAEDIGAVDVIAVKPQIIYRDNKKIMKVEEFQNAGSTTLAEVLENAPSVTLDAEGNVLLRGSGNYTLLIDGKPAPGVGINMLRQIPPEMVDNIEIMTNPSAKYDPDGVSGIINLVLKKQIESGVNGQISLMTGLGNKYNGDAQFNMRKEKINSFAGITATSYQTGVDGEIYRETGEDLSETEIMNYFGQSTDIRTLVGNLGFDYYLNERNSFTLSGRFGPQHIIAGLDNQIERSLSDPLLTGNFNFSNDIEVNGVFYMPNLSWDHKFKKEGHKLQLSAFAGGFQGDMIQTMKEEAADNSWNSTGVITDMKHLVNGMDINDMRMKIDYELPVEGKGKLEAGYQYRLMIDKNDQLLENYDIAQDIWIENPAFSNELILNRAIHATYLTWGGALGKFNYHMGIRAEFTDRLIDQKASGEEFEYTKLNFFPSGNISRKIKETMQLQLSYSRRINRPGRNQLNPFPQFADNQLIVKGNPDLTPEFIDSYELGLQNQVKIGFLSAEAYYRKVNGLMTAILTPDEDGVMYQSVTNANQSHSAGTEFMANIQPKTWLRLIASGNIYYYRLDDEMVYAENDNSSMVWTSNVTGIFLPTKTSRFTLSAIYNGPSINLQGTQKASYMINMGVRQELFKRKASIALSMRDVFKTFKIENEMKGEGYTTTTSIRPESQIATLTFTYNFNNYRQRAQDETMDLNFIR